MAPVFSQSDLISLGRAFQTCIKLNVNNIFSRPFSLATVKDFDKGDMKLAQTIYSNFSLKIWRDVEFE